MAWSMDDELSLLCAPSDAAAEKRKHSIKRPRSSVPPLDVAVLSSPLRSERNERASLSGSILIEGISILNYCPSIAFCCSYKIALLFHLLHQTVGVSFAHYFVFPNGSHSSTTSRLTLDDSLSRADAMYHSRSS